MPGNSPTFKKRYKYYSKFRKNPRVPKRSGKKTYSRPEDHSDLFTDENPRGTVKGLKFKDRESARKSVKRLNSMLRSKKVTYAHAMQIANTMEQRAKYHAHSNKNIKAGGKVWSGYKKKLKSSRKK